jgi:hypothetical protein
MRLSAGYRADLGLSTGYDRRVISPRLSLVVVSFLLLTAQAPLAPSLPAPPPREAGVAVEVLDAKGEPPRQGRAVELSVAEDGAARRVLSVGPVPAETPWRVVIWVDRVLSGSRTVRGAAGALAAQAPALVALGTVEVVVAEPEPRVVLAPTRDDIGAGGGDRDLGGQRSGGGDGDRGAAGLAPAGRAGGLAGAKRGG